MPPIRSLGDWRSSLLICDECDAVMDINGNVAPTPHGASTPDDLAPHYMPRSDLDLTARATGWNEDDGGRWSCPPCSSRRAPSR